MPHRWMNARRIIDRLRRAMSALNEIVRRVAEKESRPAGLAPQFAPPR
jgi:hypothetical protein